LQACCDAGESGVQRRVRSSRAGHTRRRRGSFVYIPTARPGFEPGGACFAWPQRLLPLHAAASRRRVLAASNRWLAGGHRYNRRLAQDPGSGVFTGNDQLRRLAGGDFNCHINSAA
jgi:hypothetical protein